MKSIRKTYTTSLDSKLIQEFRIYCVTNDLKQNEVIEKLIRELLKKQEEGGKIGNNS